MPEDVLRVQIRRLERDAGDEVDEVDEICGIDLELGVAAVEHAFGLRVDSRCRTSPAGCPSRPSISLRSFLLLYGLQRVVDELAGGGFIRVGETPTLLEDLGLPLGEGIGDVFEEDQAEDRVLVNGGVEVRAELVGGGPQLLVELAEEGLGIDCGICYVHLTERLIAGQGK